MENNETCIHGGVSPVSRLEELHHSQGGSGRHRCPTCAYEYGFNLGSSGTWDSYNAYCNLLADGEKCQSGSVASSAILSTLGENQGGTGRHKCTNCAFKDGFVAGILTNTITSIKLKLVPAPTTNQTSAQSKTSASTIDFIEQELRNKRLGLLGELFVLKNEKDFLTSNGRDDLASNVKHVSVEIGDGLGFDILSFNLDGREKKIEVKTTRSDITRPFYITKNELKVASENPDSYELHRIFDFDSNLKIGKYYKITGDLTNRLTLDALAFIAYPKANSV